MTTEQKAEATTYEKIVDEGLAGYVEIGLALRHIQNRKLHEGRFVDYAIDRFGMKSHTIYRLIRAAEVAQRLENVGLPRPKNAGQAHRLHEVAKDDPAEQVEIWRELVVSGVPATTSAIDRLVEADKQSQQVEDEVEAEMEGEVDLESAHHVEPVKFPSSDAEPLPCLQRASQELRAVKNGIHDGCEDLEPLHEEIEVIANLLKEIRVSLAAKTLAA